MKRDAFSRLSIFNARLAKYSLLAGLETLGLLDCNKYFVSFSGMVANYIVKQFYIICYFNLSALVLNTLSRSTFSTTT